MSLKNVYILCEASVFHVLQPIWESVELIPDTISFDEQSQDYLIEWIDIVWDKESVTEFIDSALLELQDLEEQEHMGYKKIIVDVERCSASEESNISGEKYYDYIFFPYILVEKPKTFKIMEEKNYE